MKKEKWKKPRRKKWRTLRNEQNNLFPREKQCFLQMTKNTQNTKKGWRPTAPKHTCRVLFVVPLVSSRSRIVFVYLVHWKKCHSSFFFFSWWLCFVLCFHFCFYCALCFWFCCFFFVWPKNQIKSQNIWNFHFDFLLSCLHPRIFHLAQLRTPTRTREPPLKMVFDSFLWFLTMCWYTNFYSVSWTSTRISPNQNGP